MILMIYKLHEIVANPLWRSKPVKYTFTSNRSSTCTYFASNKFQINNAGNGILASLLTSEVDDLDRMYKMHVRAVFLLTKMAAASLIERKGWYAGVFIWW